MKEQEPNKSAFRSVFMVITFST